jgi:hypothetical protein
LYAYKDNRCGGPQFTEDIIIDTAIRMETNTVQFTENGMPLTDGYTLLIIAKQASGV